MSEIFKLWENTPLFCGGEIPTIEYYKAKVKKGNGAILIFPGGGYNLRVSHEGEAFANFFTEKGIDCFVVGYRVRPNVFPRPLLDGRRAIRFVRANAEKFGIDPNKLAVMGSSAGGHLAGLLSTYFNEIDGEGVDEMDRLDCKPNGQILCYPVTDYEGNKGSFDNLFGREAKNFAEDFTPYLLCDENTPPTFIWHTAEDKDVNVNGSLRYALKLHENKASVELHIYPYERHGLGLAEDFPYIKNWREHLISWLILHGFLNE